MVSVDEIDDYIKEVSARLTFFIEGKCDAEDMFRYKINPKKPFGNYSYEYWAGVMSALNWITMGSENTTLNLSKVNFGSHFLAILRW